MSPPDTPEESPATAGEQYSQKTLGHGNFLVKAASIHTSNAYEETCRISLVYVSGGSETEICLERGKVSQNEPFALSRERPVLGPGYIRAYVVNLAATSFSFAVSVDRVGRRLLQ